MEKQYSVELCRKLEEEFHTFRLHRPMHIARYEPGTELTYLVTAVENKTEAKVHLVIEDFIGGGFAGQVYKVRISKIELDSDSVGGLQTSDSYAMKILIPPSGFARLFRNLLYWVGFQGPFQLQVNPVAARAGALWQKFIRRAAKIKFGDENSVVDIYATFIDEKLGSCGELSEWIEGRTWRLEVDDHMDLLKLYFRGRKVDESKLSSVEYRAKRKFMADFVTLLHDIGAHEFARQYEWSTFKSQPNCLKLRDTENDPSGGLVAVDFRAGLALLPFLPLSPGDFKLIGQGFMRGSLVQFDRGDINKLHGFVNLYSEHFADMKPMLKELKDAENIYRGSVPDITHNHIELLYSRKLWSAILDSAVTSWKIRGFVDEQNERKLRSSKARTLTFLLLGLIPFLGKAIIRCFTQVDWQKHYLELLTSWDYFKRAVRAKITETLIKWHRAGRVDSERTSRISKQPWRFFCHLPLSIIPFAGLHRFLTDADYAKERLAYICVRPLKLYFNAELREQWLRDIVEEGKRDHILTDEDADTILSQLHERYIQRYLISVAVHFLTAPVTQIVSIILAWIYYLRTGDKLGAGGILILFQIIPISPGSICRGLYTVGIAIHDRSFKDYNIAIYLSFLKYIGYLAFPIQMTYHYPALARFMACHFATLLVHIVPVFGERGALLEHWVFCLYYNWPLTIRRRMANRAKFRAAFAPRFWHVPVCALIAAVIFGLTDMIYLKSFDELPALVDIWWMVLLVPALCGCAVTVACRGAIFWKRFVAAAICGAAVGLFYTLITVLIGSHFGLDVQIIRSFLWRAFDFAVISTIAAIITELKLPDPHLKQYLHEKI